MEQQIFVSAENLRKSFRISKNTVDVLKGVSMQVFRGEWVALLGASGSGKTTLLDIIGTISHPDSGTLIIDNIDTGKLSHGNLVNFRRKNIGFVFQSYHLLPELTILENAMLPLLLDGGHKKTALEKAKELLVKVGLENRIMHRPNELSGGEQQRASLARALINTPKLLLADEPTGNLDSVTGGEILELFKTIHAEGNTTIIMVTHDRSVAALADRRIELHDGLID